MLEVKSGVPSAAFALVDERGTILLSDLDASASHVERLGYGYSIHHPERGECRVVPVTVTVETRDAIPVTSEA
jgi:hypothetical protein